MSTLTLSTSQIYNNNCTVSERVCLHDLRSDILQVVTNFLSVSQLIINNISAQLIFTDCSPVELSTKFRESFNNIRRKPYKGIPLPILSLLKISSCLAELDLMTYCCDFLQHI